MNRTRRRSLSGEERRLWAEVARSVLPLPGRPAPEPPPAPAGSVPAAPAPEPTVAAAGATRPATPPVKPLAPVETRTVRALARGRVRADATLDLHGMTQAGAHAALLRFLHRSQADGCRLVLVVTGKGRPEEAFRPSDRGVLRRVVPQWLGLPETRGLVLGWTEAGPRQGGAGAIYVRLRRPALLRSGWHADGG